MSPLRSLLPVLLASLGCLQAAEPASSAAPKHPNILVIITDQQNSTMLSCTGNPYVKTPVLDSLAAAGARFELAHCAVPVCSPSRFSLMSGVMPSRVGMETNKDDKKTKVAPALLENTLGQVFKRAGYETVYGGKTHLPMEVEEAGFKFIEKDEREKLAVTCSAFLRQPHDRPFLMVASFINPHDICYMAISDAKNMNGSYNGPKEVPLEAMTLPPGMSEKTFYSSVCPPLPPNFAIPAGEPDQILAADTRPFRFHARHDWTDEQWRLHRWAYARLTERADKLIGDVLATLRDTGLEKDTLVVFSTDHGEMDSSHHLEHKSVLYDEAARIPFIVSWKGVTKPGLVDREHLITTGLDLIPTLCDFAGIPAPAPLKGLSVRALAEGREPASWRKAVVVENGSSRMLRTAQYKYIVYAAGARREMLVDMKADPGELKNLAMDPAFTTVLEEHRQLLKEWYTQNGETLDGKYVATGKVE